MNDIPTPDQDESAIRADERRRILEDVYYWSDRLDMSPIDVPAIVALFVDTSPAGPDDLIWAQHVAHRLADHHRPSGEVS